MQKDAKPVFKSSTCSILFDGSFNKGLSYTKEEREKLGLDGLIPLKIETMEEQEERIWALFTEIKVPLEKYEFLQALRFFNETLFYKVVVDHIIQTVPFLYTPVVGEACIKFDTIWKFPNGLFISYKNKGEIQKLINNWRLPNVKLIVVTDGSRILGLGDLGINGLGIPIGKLQLYSAGAGIDPRCTLPIVLDVGTNNEKLLNSKTYFGLKMKRLRGKEFYEFFEEFMLAVIKRWPKCCVQFEDFSNDVAFDILDIWKNKHLSFNDDIQGTGAVITAGFINASKMANIAFKDHKVLFFGMGSAAVGCADQISRIFFDDPSFNNDEQKVKDVFYFVDSVGLVCAARKDPLQHHKLKYVRKDINKNLNFVEAIKEIEPTVLCGLSGVGQTFTEEVLTTYYNICKKNKRKPIIFALSNPTSKSECSAEQAYKYTNYEAIFCSGSPFDPVKYKDENGNEKIISPGQGNNFYTFPGIGLGAICSDSKVVSEDMIYAASKTLAAETHDEELKNGSLYPSLTRIREISKKIACAICERAQEQKLTDKNYTHEEWIQVVEKNFYEPKFDAFECY